MKCVYMCVCVHVCVCACLCVFDVYLYDRDLKCYNALYLLRTQHLNEITTIYYLTISVRLFFKENINLKQGNTIVIIKLYQQVIWGKNEQDRQRRLSKLSDE